MEHTIVFHDLVIGGSAQRPAARPRKRPDNLLPANLPPIGGTLEQIAIYIGVSENKYVELVRRGLMPPPKIIDGRRVHDFEAARAAFKRLTTDQWRRDTDRRRLLRRGLMPPPKIIDGRRVHDCEAARAAFKRLPTTNGVGTPIDRQLLPRQNMGGHRQCHVSCHRSSSAGVIGTAKVRAYFRKDRGPRIPLPNTIGSPEFVSAYQDALAGRCGRNAHAPRCRFHGHHRGAHPKLSEQRRLSKSAGDDEDRLRLAARNGEARARTTHGRPASTGERITKAFLEPYADRPGAALSMLKMLRILIRHAIMLGWLQHDPSLGIKRPKQGEVRSWTRRRALAQFEAHWPVGTKQRLAFALMLYTGQRRSDVHRMDVGRRDRRTRSGWFNKRPARSSRSRSTPTFGRSSLRRSASTWRSSRPSTVARSLWTGSPASCGTRSRPPVYRSNASRMGSGRLRGVVWLRPVARRGN